MKEQQAQVKRLEERLKALELRHKQELDALKSELSAYQVAEQQKANEEKIKQLQIDLNNLQGNGNFSSFGRLSLEGGKA